MGRQPPIAPNRLRRPPRRLRAASICCALAAAVATLLVPSAARPLSIGTAAGLAYLAPIDWEQQRVPRGHVRVLAVGTCALLLLGTLAGPELSPLRAFAAGGFTFAGLGVLWWCAPHMIGFADVKTTAIAMLAASAVGWRTAVTVLLATSVVALLMAAWFALVGRRDPTVDERRTIPLLPALSTGFVIGVAPW